MTDQAPDQTPGQTSDQSAHRTREQAAPGHAAPAPDPQAAARSGAPQAEGQDGPAPAATAGAPAPLADDDDTPEDNVAEDAPGDTSDDGGDDDDHDGDDGGDGDDILEDHGDAAAVDGAEDDGAGDDGGISDDDDEPGDAAPVGGERIAKVIARAGLASRREAERMILEGRVSVNGQPVTSPALDVRPSDRVVVDGTPLEAPQPTRLWLYYKPLGLVTSESDEKGRQTIYDALPRDLPRVMTVGRLDLNSEGLLLLTNDGELKRRLELPATGWLRRYRVRVNGQPNELTFAPLRRGVTIDGEDFAPMEITIDSQKGANAWLTVGIREGRNREIRRAMAHVGLIVNRLIRIGYGPFKLTGLEPNEVREVRRKILRDQLGGLLTGEPEAAEERPRAPRKPGEGRPFTRRDDAEGAKPRTPRKPGEGRPFSRRDDAEGAKPRTPYKPGGPGPKGAGSRGPKGPGGPKGPRGPGGPSGRPRPAGGKPRRPQ